MPFLWYYLQFHSAGWGLLPGQLRAFLSHHNPCGKHELILWLRWSLVEALLSQPSVTDTSRSTRIDWENSCQRSPMQHGFPCSSSFLCSYLCQWSCFLASICPPGPWTAAQCVSWWLRGLWGDFARKKKKREGSQRPSGLCKHIVFCRAPQLSFSTARKKAFSLSCSFCSACGGRNVGVKWPLLSICLHAGISYYSRAGYLLGDLHSPWVSYFSPGVCYWPKRGVEFNLLIYQCMLMLPGIDSSLSVSPQRNLCWGEAATSHLTLWLYVTGVSCRAEIVTVWQADSRGLESKDLAGSLCFCGCGMCIKWFEWSIEKVVAWGILLFLFDYWFLLISVMWHMGHGF